MSPEAGRPRANVLRAPGKHDGVISVGGARRRAGDEVCDLDERSATRGRHTLLVIRPFAVSGAGPASAAASVFPTTPPVAVQSLVPRIA